MCVRDSVVGKVGEYLIFQAVIATIEILIVVKGNPRRTKDLSNLDTE